MRNENWLEKADWKRFQNQPHLPQTLDYFNKNIIGVNGPKRFLFSPPFPFEKGFTEASYSVEEFTNIAGLTLPIKFSFKIFYLDWTLVPAQLKTNWNILGEVTNVRSACERTNFIPELTEPTYVDDRRFAHAKKPVEALAYMITNGDWPETNAQSLQKSYQDALKVRADMIKYEVKPKQFSNHKWIWLSAISIVLTIAVIVRLMKNNRRK